MTESVKLAYGNACPELNTVAAVQVGSWKVAHGRQCTALLKRVDERPRQLPSPTRHPPHSPAPSPQSLSGTGSCRLMAELQRRYLPHSTIYIPVPTWSNHHNIWRDAGVPQVRRVLCITCCTAYITIAT